MSGSTQWPRCYQCRAANLHRHKRSWLQRIFSYLAPIRPLRCGSCKTIQWRLLPPSLAPLNYLCSVVVWSGLMLLIFGGLDPQAPPEPLLVQPPVQPTVQEEGASEPQTSPGVPAAADEASLVLPEEPGAPEPVAVPKLEMASVLTGKLQQVVIQSQPDSSTIVLKADRPMAHSHLSKSSSAEGFILDIQGKWELAAKVKRVRKFEQGNLKEVSIGEHPDFLRVVLRLHDLQVPRPELSRQDSELRITVQESRLNAE